MDYILKIHETQTCYQGFFTLEKHILQHSLYKGGMSAKLSRELLYYKDAVAVLLYDPHEDAVVLIEQFRIGARHDKDNPWVLELVAGFQEPGEDIDTTVAREVWEESGLQVSAFEPVCEFYINPANTSDRITLVCAQVDAKTAEGVHGMVEEGEDIRVLVYPYRRIQGMIESGRINSATPILAMQWLQLNREGLRARWRNR